MFPNHIITTENPVKVSWDLRFSNADFAKLKCSIIPRDIDHKWQIRLMTYQEVLDEEVTNRVTAAMTRDEPPVEGDSNQRRSRGWPCAEKVMRNKPPLKDEELHLYKGGNTSIRRSWSSKQELCTLTAKPNKDSTNAKIGIITWEKSQLRHISEEQAEIGGVLICRQKFECELAATSDDGPILVAGAVYSIVD